MKKTICAFLAIAMCMALALPAFAGSVNSGDVIDETKYTGSVKTPTIKVTAGTTNSVILNPYKIAITRASVISGQSGNDIKASVISPTLVLKNESDVPLNMSLTVTGEVPQGSTAKFASTKPADDEKNHAVFMYVAVTNVGSKADGDAPTAATNVFGTVPAYADASVYNSDTNKTGTQAVVKAGDVKMQNFMTLAVPASNQKGYATIDIGGECAKTPTDAWAATDTVNVKLAFTFVASANSGS